MTAAGILSDGDQTAPRTELLRPGRPDRRALHGYAILKRVEELSGTHLRMSTRTLYVALERLPVEGLLTPGVEEVVEGRPRRAYSLTERGLTAA